MSKNIFFFHGEDSYSSKQKVQAWKKAFIQKYGDTNLEIITGKELNAGSFLTNIESLPFLSEKRLTIVNNFLAQGREADQKQIVEYLKEKQLPDFSVLIFHETKAADKRTSIYKTLNKKATTEEFKNLEPRELAQKLAKQAPLSNLTANYLVEYCGTDQHKLYQELEKLKLYCQNRQANPEDIEKLCTPSLSASVFQLTDQLASSNPKKSLQAFQKLVESGEDPIKVFFMIVRHFRILIQVKDLLDQSVKDTTITKILKQHPYVIKKSIQQCKNFSSQKLHKIYKNLLKIDHQFKTGIIKNFQTDNKEYQLAIEKMLISCCQK